ncbi:MAG: radical SAM protein [Thermoprotei archaeon]|nr:MAG: radical SAM protein [Thermoprotei archaeon]
MDIKFYKCIIDESKCVKCGACSTVNLCYSPGACVGCLSCFFSCPYEARKIVEDTSARREIRVEIDDVEYSMPERITVLKAIELAGYSIGVYPNEARIHAPCRTGGCWSCAVEINGSLERSCITPLEEGMKISTDVREQVPLRIVHGPEPHTVGGKATPYYEKRRGKFIEAAIWVAGCNLRCPQCQNWHVTYDNITEPLTPQKAAERLTAVGDYYGVSGLAISGGEPTLNRRWLVEFFRALKELNKGKKRRLHLDSNGTLLTPDYIDELVEAGCNNIGVEPKCVSVESYMRITGLVDGELAEKYLKTSWSAIKYIVDHYGDRVYLGVGLVYNKDLVSLDEVAKAGEKLASIDPEIQVCVLDYFPAFRRRDLKRPSVFEMLKVKKILNDTGLRKVIVQTQLGHFGP